MNKTGIPQFDFTWSPTSGCSYGCPECFVRRLYKRFPNHPRADFKPRVHPERFGDPAKRKKPAVIGVCLGGDLYDPQLPDLPHVVGQVYEAAHKAPQHTYCFITKRADLMEMSCDAWRVGAREEVPSNWFMGITVRNQAELDAAAPHLRALAVQGWKTWLSIEPMQGLVNIPWPLMGICEPPCDPCDFFGCKGVPTLSGVILGGQSGKNAPPLYPDWVRQVRDNCEAAGIPFMFKQWGEWVPAAERGNLFGECTGMSDGGIPNGKYKTHIENGWRWFRVGTQFSGNTLDGRTHTALPWKLATK